MNYRLLAPALEDLDEIDATVTERFGTAVADRVYAGLLHLFGLLADHQGMGHRSAGHYRRAIPLLQRRTNWIIYEPGDPMLIHRIYPAALDVNRFR